MLPGLWRASPFSFLEVQCHGPDAIVAYLPARMKLKACMKPSTTTNFKSENEHLILRPWLVSGCSLVWDNRRTMQMLIWAQLSADQWGSEILNRVFESTEKSSKANRSMWQGKPLWQCSAVYGCLHCFDTVGWASGRALACKKNEWRGAGVVICLQWGANDFHMDQLMPLLPRHLLLH